MNAKRKALVHALKVAMYIVGSAVIPALLSLYANEPRWLALAPALNVAAAYLVKYSEIKRGQ